ncbi:MAG: hypothetical protein NPIRA06_25330 [Nitrospirales bacterium]|nr:MAG: hypothetical protein NPIRA06_25330 [Nitrospirales bacterium]
MDDEGDGVPFKVDRLLFSSMISHDPPPLAISVLFKVSISIGPPHLAEFHGKDDVVVNLSDIMTGFLNGTFKFK